MANIPKSPVLGRLGGDDVRNRTPRLPFGEAVVYRTEQSFNPTRKSNLLVAGPAGSGRSNVTDVLAAAAQLQGATVYGIRAYGAEDVRYHIFANGLESAENLINTLYAEVRDRVQTIKRFGASTIEHVPLAVRPGRIFIVVDGLSRLPLQEKVPDGTLEEARAEYYGFLLRSIDRLSRVGMHLRVHVIVVTDSLEFTLPNNTAAIHLDAAGVGQFNEGVPDDDQVQVWESPTGAQLKKALSTSAAARTSNRSPHVSKT
jgi:hypothetical protein